MASLERYNPSDLSNGEGIDGQINVSETRNPAERFGCYGTGAGRLEVERQLTHRLCFDQEQQYR